MRAVVIVPMKPATDGPSGFGEVVKIVLPGALFIQAAKEAFNQAVLLRR